MTGDARTRGKCSRCGQDVPLTKRGTIKVHYLPDNGKWPPTACGGWGTEPQSGDPS